MLKNVLAIVIACLLATGHITATIIKIPNDYATIQTGINFSFNGDTVIVKPGKYVENINFNGHNIVLGSLFLITGDTSYIKRTVIDGNLSGSVVIFESGEDNTTSITGFTIKNGHALYGGGIYCEWSNPEIISNLIIDNFAELNGGGIYSDYSTPDIENNAINDNRSNNCGGGIYSTGAFGPSIRYCLISNNYADSAGGGIALMGNSNSYLHGLSNNHLITNSASFIGGGIYCHTFTHLFLNNIILNNHTSNSGGGVYFSLSEPDLWNNIIWGNYASDLSQIGYDSSSVLFVMYNNIQDSLWLGGANISENPLFRNPELGDYHLMAIECGDPYDSPCIDGGWYGREDTVLSCEWGLGLPRCDMGAFSGGDFSVGIDEIGPVLPNNISISQNYPNPFNAATTINYELPYQSHVMMEIYNILGRKVTMLIDKQQQAGYHKAIWNADDFSSGMYFYKLQAGDYTETKAMTLMK
ncbi:MAG: T9SS type A sorting domain-containing protein [candidate division Zixibacteria bacterium]|nr:T9SS type A sorting domain-containing protein [candidate division Zixibacteria bacterium]